MGTKEGEKKTLHSKCEGCNWGWARVEQSYPADYKKKGAVKKD